MSDEIFKRALHNPPHLFLSDTFYMLTASTYERAPVMFSERRKMDWIEAFLKAGEIYKWQIIAWVVLDNHYHAILKSPKNAHTLSKFVSSYHKFTSRKWNEEDQVSERKLWWNYWDTCLRSENDFYNRLQYVFWNPVKHGLSDTPEEYAFSNYKEFLLNWDVVFDFTNVKEVEDVPEF